LCKVGKSRNFKKFDTILDTSESLFLLTSQA
jgi:hypothetical protein